MELKVFEYKNCGTCKKALKYLESKKVKFTKVPIRETPPSVTELKKMLSHVGKIGKLFNTSGADYREMGIKDKINSMKEEEAFNLLSKNGNLVKRPFVLGKDFGLVGFKEEEWSKHF